jgi:hypothetical protein
MVFTETEIFHNNNVPLALNGLNYFGDNIGIRFSSAAALLGSFQGTVVE